MRVVFRACACKEGCFLRRLVPAGRRVDLHAKALLVICDVGQALEAHKLQNHRE